MLIIHSWVNVYLIVMYSFDLISWNCNLEHFQSAFRLCGYLEQHPHGAAGGGRVELQQLLLGAVGARGDGAAVTHISSLTLKQQTPLYFFTSHSSPEGSTCKCAKQRDCISS